MKEEKLIFIVEIESNCISLMISMSAFLNCFFFIFYILSKVSQRRKILKNAGGSLIILIIKIDKTIRLYVKEVLLFFAFLITCTQ